MWIFLVLPAWSADADKKTWKQGCKGGDMEACVELGLLEEQTLPQSMVAKRLYERACEGGSARGCGERGAFSFREDDLPQAIAWASRGCPVQSPPPCTDETCRAGTARACRAVYAAADEAQDFALAGQAGTLACRMGDGEMCLVTYNTPRLSDTDKLGVLQLGCEEAKDARMCNEFGVQLSLGDLGVKDEARGTTILDRACDMGSVDACLSRAETLGSLPSTAAEARPFLEKACALGSKSACRKLEGATP